jgi:hypothetical protein
VLSASNPDSDDPSAIGGEVALEESLDLETCAANGTENMSQDAMVPRVEAASMQPPTGDSFLLKPLYYYQQAMTEEATALLHSQEKEEVTACWQKLSDAMMEASYRRGFWEGVETKGPTVSDNVRVGATFAFYDALQDFHAKHKAWVLLVQETRAMVSSRKAKGAASTACSSGPSNMSSAISDTRVNNPNDKIIPIPQQAASKADVQKLDALESQVGIPRDRPGSSTMTTSNEQQSMVCEIPGGSYADPWQLIEARSDDYVPLKRRNTTGKFGHKTAVPKTALPETATREKQTKTSRKRKWGSLKDSGPVSG